MSDRSVMTMVYERRLGAARYLSKLIERRQAQEVGTGEECEICALKGSTGGNYIWFGKCLVRLGEILVKNI